MKLRMFGSGLLAGLSLLTAVMASPVEARNPSSNPYRTPCHDDRIRLCSTASPGKAGSCLKKHINELSPACKAQVKKK